MNALQLMTNLQWTLCYKFDDGSASSMRSRHLIHNSKYATGWRVRFHLRKYDTTKTHLGILWNVVKYLWDDPKYSIFLEHA